MTEVLQARFWEVVPGHTVGSLRLQVIASFLYSYVVKACGRRRKGNEWVC